MPPSPPPFLVVLLDRTPRPRQSVEERMREEARNVGLDFDTMLDMTFAQYAWAIGARRALRDSHKIAVAVQARRAVRP
jgi:lipocalin